MYFYSVTYHYAIAMVIIQGRWSGWLCEICGILVIDRELKFT